MPNNLRGRWDKLYSEVRVCVFCAQLFEPTVKTLEQQLEEERKEDEILRNQHHDPHRHEEPQTDDGAEDGLSWHQQRAASSKSVANIRRQRSLKLAARNSAVFRRRCGFGSSNAQRPRNFWGEAVGDDEQFGAAGGATHAHGSEGRDDNDVKRKQVRIPRAATENASIMPLPPQPPPRRRPGTANARSRGRSYHHRAGGPGKGSGVAAAATRPARPKSAAQSRTPGFGSTSSRIITYRGHNRQDPKVHMYRHLRIDPVQQAKAMLAATQFKDAKGTSGLRTGTVATRRRFVGVKRPASAGVGRRLRGERKGSGSKRPQTASVWPHRRNRVPRPQWRNIL